MFARVITAQIEPDGHDRFVDFARHELPTAAEIPGFAGYFVLTDDETGKAMIISLWETHEQMSAVAASQRSGIKHDGSPATGLSTMTLQTYEVALRA